jgi:hypothetical protein
VWYELGFKISEDGILHSHRCKNLKSYTDCLHVFSFYLLANSPEVTEIDAYISLKAIITSNHFPEGSDKKMVERERTS